MTIEDILGPVSVLTLAGSVFLIAYVLWVWFRVTDRIAVWIIEKLSKKIPSFIKGLF